MDEFTYNTIESYFHSLENFGYSKRKNVESLLILIFFYNLVYHDYRGFIKKTDYHTIEKALNCLYGSTCLIPYPDYLKMGKLHIGDVVEMAQRIKTLEDEPILKLIHDASTIDNADSQDDITITAEEDNS
jgi:hypothetical protein